LPSKRSIASLEFLRARSPIDPNNDSISSDARYTTQLVGASLEGADIAGAEINDSQAFNELGARVTVEEKAEEQ
jgi:hypothetical protein